MPKVILPYTVNNSLSNFIQRQADITEHTQKQIEEELATYCSITWEGVRRIKYNRNIPSLPVAFKIAEYFSVNIEDIFKIENVT